MKEHKANLGLGLAKCNFSFLENVIKGIRFPFHQITNIIFVLNPGKKQTPPLSDQLTDYCRTERLTGEGDNYLIDHKTFMTGGQYWICKKVLILFPGERRHSK